MIKIESGIPIPPSIGTSAGRAGKWALLFNKMSKGQSFVVNEKERKSIMSSHVKCKRTRRYGLVSRAIDKSAGVYRIWKTNKVM